MAAVRGARLSLGAEVALASVSGVGFFALVAIPLAVADSALLAVVLIAAAAAAVVAMFGLWGVAYAVPAAVAGLLAFDWFYVPPTHPHSFPDAESLTDLLFFLAVGVLIGQLASRASRRAATSELARSELASEQAALRRVATLVARGVSPEQLFATVCDELERLLDIEEVDMVRLEGDGTFTVLSFGPRNTGDFPVGRRLPIEGRNAVSLVVETERPARIDDYSTATGPIGEIAKSAEVRGVVGCPIVVQGRLWGVVVAATRREDPLPADSEARIGEFTELVATAIANAEARREVATLADEQAALRRVATLVAQAAPPDDLFDAVAAEVCGLLGSDIAGITRYERDGTVTVVAGSPPSAWAGAPRTGWPVEGCGVVEIVAKTQGPFRIDDYEGLSGPAAEFLRDQGVVSSVGAPIVLEGRLWGTLNAHSTDPSRPLPPNAESRIEEFTELVATAIANSQARSDLAASRARIVAAEDVERRRVVRDLHDGAQQRLVHTVVTLNMASSALEEEERDDAADLVSEALRHAEEATGELRELAHGILPSVLTQGGLRAGVGALASRMPVPVENGVSVDRLPAAVEATAYFIVAEALTNVAKHSHASHAVVTARTENGTLQIQVRDDGIGGARASGTGLVGLADRVSALDGTLRLESPDDGGTLVAAGIPVVQRE